MEKRSFDANLLDASQTHFQRQGDTLSMTAPDGTTYPRVVLRGCFPMSKDMHYYLSIRDATSEEHEEIGMLRDWSELAETDREAVAKELQLFYFVPRIRSVQSVRSEFGFLYWEVDTDKGELEFVMRDNTIRYARQVSDTRWILIDVNKARYEIHDLDALDSHGQKLVKRWLHI